MSIYADAVIDNKEKPMSQLERYAETLGRIQGVAEMSLSYLTSDAAALVRIREILEEFEAAKKEATA